MPVIVTKVVTMLMAAFGFITMTTTSIIIMTEEGEKMEFNYDQLAEEVKEEIKEYTNDNPDEFYEDGHFVFNEQRALDISIETVIERLEDNLPEGEGLTEEHKERLEEELKSRVQKDVQDIVKEIKEEWDDAELYRKDPMRYHGLRWSDFY